MSQKTCEDEALDCIFTLQAKNTHQSPEKAVKKIVYFYCAGYSVRLLMPQETWGMQLYVSMWLTTEALKSWNNIFQAQF